MFNQRQIFLSLVHQHYFKDKHGNASNISNAQEMALNWPYAQKIYEKCGKTSLELSTTRKEESWTVKEQLEAVHERVGYSWVRAKALAKNCMHYRVLVDALYVPLRVIRINDEKD